MLNMRNVEELHCSPNLHPSNGEQCLIPQNVLFIFLPIVPNQLSNETTQEITSKT